MQSEDMDHPPSKRRRINMDSLATQQSSSPSSSSTHSWTYDVFLSFRGEDTRYDFTDHLHKNLVEEGIRTFRDDKLPRGEEISQALVQAIQGSKSSLIVFSENYASSKWCLDELVHILECKTSNRQQKVWLVFYKVDPSDVRNQRGSFGAAFAKHESNLKGNMERVMRWKAALLEAGKLSGWHFQGGMYESKFIDGIVKEISAQVKEPTYLDVPKCSVGLDSRVQDMLQCLDVGGTDIRMVGIWGIGGIGKTTTAKAVYNSIAHKFEFSCFLANVREVSEAHGGLLNLQKILLSKIVRGKELILTSVDEGITLLRDSLRDKRILLILDDVENLDQLDKLARATEWFFSGSRIIITTRDKHLLTVHKVSHIYKATELDPRNACELFISKAFKNKTYLDDDEKLSISRVVQYAQGLPLALVVLGSRLCGTSIHKWQAILDGYKRSPLRGIQNILKISYDALENSEKEVFLDIACFFKNQNKNYVIQRLKGCGRINPEHDIEVLEEKALINVEYGKICLHDLLEEMGKSIVHQESPNEPGKRSRLWFHEDVHDVLTENTGTSKIEGIIVKMPTTEEIRLSPKCFKKMKNLKIFINVNARFCGKLDYLPEKLRLVDWPNYPFQSLPSKFNMKKLVELNMPCSQISRLGKGFKPSLNLKSIKFANCEFLTKIPDLSGCPNLEQMYLIGCKSLVEVHCSVGSLEKLVDLDLRYCKNLVKLPRKVNWRCLRHFQLEFCEKLKSLPEIVGEMKYLTRLYLNHCHAIKELPSSIRYLINLEKLSVAHCENLTNLPCSIYQLQKLEEISLFDCQKLTTFPNKVNSVLLMPTGSKVSHGNSNDGEGCSSFCQLLGDREFNFGLPSLRKFNVSSLSDSDFLASVDCAFTLNSLDLSESNIVSLSECLCKFMCLRELLLHDCRNLVEIPQLPPCIELLVVRDCISLERISKLSKILEREESQMIEEMDLCNCCRLIENLVKETNVLVNDDYQAADALFSLFLSCQQSKFTVEFPGSKIPKWFSCQMEFKGLCRFEFVIEILANFKWENTGLALCFLKQHDLYSCQVDVSIDINEVKVLDLPDQDVDSIGLELDHVWLHYIPFLEMGGDGYMRPLPPFMCRVIIYTYYGELDIPPTENEESDLVKSCGVHLVMPPNEDVCMKLSRVKCGDIYKDDYEDYEDYEDDEDDDEDDEDVDSDDEGDDEDDEDVDGDGDDDDEDVDDDDDDDDDDDV